MTILNISSHSIYIKMVRIIKFLRYPAYFLLFSYFIFISFQNISDLDYFFHIKTGEYILSNKTIPNTDPYSFTMTNKPWSNHEWLYQVMIYFTYHNFGFNGLFLFRIIPFILTFILLLFIIADIDWPIGFFIIFFSMKIVYSRLVLRPDTFCFLFYIIFLLPFFYKKRWLLYLLPFIQVLWVNIHGFFYLGPIILGLYLLTKSFNKESLDKSFEQTVKYIFFLTILACFFTPHPIETIIYPIRVIIDIFSGANKILYDSIQELEKPWRDFNSNKLTFIYISVISLLFLIFKKFNLFYFLLWGFTVFFAMNAVRNVYFIIPIGFIILGHYYPSLKNYIIDKLIRIKGWNIINLVLIIMIGNILISYLKDINYNVKHGRSYLSKDNKVTIKSNFLEKDSLTTPDNMASFIRRNKLPEFMYNDFNAGSYLIFRCYPQRRVFIDGRAEFYGPKFFKLYSDVEEGNKNALYRLLRQYKNIEGFIISYVLNANPPKIIKNLYKLKYKCIYFNYDGMIFITNNGLKNNPNLNKLVIDLERYDIGKIDLVNDIKLHRPSLEKFYKMGYVYYILKLYNQSERCLKEVLKVFPDDYVSYDLLGRIAYKKKHYEKAYFYGRTSLFFNRGYDIARYLLARVCVQLGKEEEAKDLAKELKKDYNKLLEEIKNEQSK